MTRTLTFCAPLAVWLLAGCSGTPSDKDDADTDRYEEDTPNTAPTAPDVTIGPVDARTDDELVATLRVPSQDADGDTVTYAYAWFQDGLARPDLTADRVPASETARGELWEVTVTPNDGEDAGPAATASVTIRNTAPTANVTLANGAPFTDEDLAALADTADADGDVVTLTYVWTRDGEATDTTGATVAADATTRGERWTVTVTPSDDADAGDAVSAEAVIANTAPEVLTVTLVPDAPYVTDDVVAVVTSTDLDGDDVAFTYTWFVDVTEVLTGPTDTLPAGIFAKGQRVTVEVVPDDGVDAGAAFVSTDAIVLNSLPTASSAAIDPAAAYESSTLSCVPAGFADADGDAEGWTYAWTVDGAAVATTATLDGGAFDKGDVVGCTATPWDGEGAGDPVVAASVTVLNAPPVLASLALSTYAPTVSDSVSASVGAAADDDGDPVELRYAWYVDGALTGGDSVLPAGSFEKGDEIYVVVTPWDGAEAGAALTSAVATGANTAPEVLTVALAPESPYVTDDIVASVTSTDLDGDAVGYSYTWSVDGTEVLSGPSDTLPAGSASKGQRVTVEVVPDDGETDGAAFSSTDVTLLNSPPTGSYASISPSVVYTDTTVTCTPSGFYDADGDAEQWAYEWSSYHGDLGVTTALMDGSAFDTGDSRLQCAATPFDGEAYGDPVLSEEVWISDSPPEVTSVALSTYSPTVDETLTGSIMVDDPDGASFYTFYVMWYVNGSRRSDIADSARPPSLPMEYLVKGDTVYLEVYCAEGGYFGWSGSVTSPVATVANTPPTAPSIALSPAIPISTEDLTCSVTTASTDADSDAITYTYTWLRDGVAYSSTDTTDTEVTLSGASVGAGEVWTCTVTAYDGEDDSTVASVAATSVDVALCDVDADGYRGALCGGLDCDDDDDIVHPYAGDTYGDGVDGDCDGLDCEASVTGGAYFTVCAQTSNISAADADANCAAAGHDGLAVPRTSAENSAIFILNQDVWAARPVSGYSVRLGGTDASTEGTWVHPRTNGLMTYKNWASSEPNNGGYSGNEDCINMIGDTGYSGLWQDLGCAAGSNGDYAYACETRLDDFCTTVSSSGRTYLFCEGARSWSDAEAACVEKGAHLATVSSSTENTFMWNQRVSLGIYRTGMWMGYSDVAAEGTWVWADASASTYTAWAEGEPGNGATLENCGAFGRELSTWFSEECWDEKFYICEY